MLTVEEAQLKLTDLKQAVDYEKKHRYIDVRGRKKPFSRFVLETLTDLSRWSLSDTGDDSRDLATLIQKFQHYPFLDLGARVRTLEALEEFLKSFYVGLSPQKKTVSVAVSEENTSETDTQKDIATAPHRAGIHDLDVQYIKGVGPKRSRILRDAGIHTAEDLLYYFPRKYLDYNNRVKIGQLTEGEDVTVMGTIKSVSAYNTQRKHISILSISVADETGSVSAHWFYAKASRAMLEHHKSRFSKGTEVMLSGRVKWDSYKKKFAIDKPQVEVLSYQDAEGENQPSSLHAGRIVPIYPLTEGLSLRFLRQVIFQVLEDFLPTLIDPLPDDLRRKYQVIPLQQALQQIHFPQTLNDYEEARKRLVFDELFYVQARLALIRAQFKRTVQGLSLTRQQGGYCDQFLGNLPFALTGAQQRSFEEICADLKGNEPMYRLLQGDVGSGKTVVALLTMLVAVENGYQAALMVPTEILAEQHYRRCVEWLTPLGLRAGLLVGKSGTRERREIKQGLLNGQIHVIVGTHALIQEDVEFLKLGLVVVDEQHRFGVRQRTLLKSKGEHPEMLTMTATPIPRTLAMTLHGDLDISLIDELPPGRSPILTSLLTSRQHKMAHQLIRAEVLKGRQAYVVFPLIEESESLSAKAATTEAERLQKEIFPDLKVGLLHGKMHPEEKEAAMNAFIRGDIHILVSTTVIEVGVDVPNATVMVIESAERFGLAQLHQLRGRVGRSSHQSYCALVCDSRGDDTMKRLNILTESENGFVIAEKDLEIRGPGEFLGTRQSGLPDFILADLIQDKAILEQARQAAFEVVSDEGYLLAHPQLGEMIFQKTEQTFNVLGSG